MVSLRHDQDVYGYMAKVADKKKVHNLNSVSVAKCYCFLLRETIFHEKLGEPLCCYFRCRMKKLLRDELVEKEEQRMLFVIPVNNYGELTDD